VQRLVPFFGLELRVLHFCEHGSSFQGDSQCIITACWHAKRLAGSRSDLRLTRNSKGKHSTKDGDGSLDGQTRTMQVVPCRLASTVGILAAQKDDQNWNHYADFILRPLTDSTPMWPMPSPSATSMGA